jgi:hypothetical protein
MSELVAANEGQSLVELDEAKRHIALARDMAMAEELHEWRDRAAAMAHYAKMRGDSQDAANQAAEIKVRAEAALGALDREARPASVGRNGAQMDSPSEPISELGVARATRANWRKLGALDEEQLDKVIEQVKATDDTISTAAVVKVVEKQTKAEKAQNLAAQAEKFAEERAAEEATRTPAEQAAAAQVVAEITNYAPTARFVSALSMLAAQAVEQVKTLPEVPADEKGVALLNQAASDYELVAKAIRTFTGGN